MCNKHVHSTVTRSSCFHCLIGVIASRGKNRLRTDLDDDEEIFSGIALADDHLALFVLRRLECIGDRQSFPVVQTR